MPPRRPKLSQEAAGLAHGWRSGLEGAIAAELGTEGTDYLYEQVAVPFVQPAKPRKYTPDFILSNGIIVETKGRFETADRAKHDLVRAQHPDLDIRFVFSRSSTRISKQSKTTYADWCRSRGFHFADKAVPTKWLGERACQIRRAAVVDLIQRDRLKLEKVLTLFGQW